MIDLPSEISGPYSWIILITTSIFYMLGNVINHYDDPEFVSKINYNSKIFGVFASKICLISIPVSILLLIAMYSDGSIKDKHSSLGLIIGVFLFVFCVYFVFYTVIYILKLVFGRSFSYFVQLPDGKWRIQNKISKKHVLCVKHDESGNQYKVLDVEKLSEYTFLENVISFKEKWAKVLKHNERKEKRQI